MRFRILGPLRVEDDAGEPIPTGSSKLRIFLVTLLTQPNYAATTDVLVDALWPTGGDARKVQVVVHRVRRTLGEDRVEFWQSGYRLRVDPGELDSREFERLSAEGRASLAAHDLDLAVESFDAALALWRGAPYSAEPEPEAVRLEARRLEELHLGVVEDRIDAMLALGRHHEFINELSTLTSQHPLRERLQAQRMLALYRAGRASEAIAVYREASALLDDELGLEPGPELRKLETAILAGDPLLDHAPVERRSGRQRAPVPAELPSPAASFTGRDDEVHQLSETLTDTSTPTPVIAISGSGGIGKSALAIRVANAVDDEFADGRLYVNLHGATPGMKPLSAHDALGHCLRSLGLADAEIPASAEEAAARYRTITNERRVLVVLDDASDVTQIRPLLPGRRSAIIVTSRPMLSTLDDAVQVPLQSLSPDEAVVLLARLAGTERVAAEPGGANEIVRLCGGLPLALRIAGARLQSRREMTLASFAERLADQHGRLDELQYADLAVRSNLAISVDALDAEPLRLFRYLGILEFQLHDITAPVVAALADRPISAVQRDLDTLVDAQLVEADSDRYRFHDLVMLYAAERAHDEFPEIDDLQRTQAIRRFLHHYLATVRNAWFTMVKRRTARLETGVPTSEIIQPGLPLDSPEAISEWTRAEAANVVAIARNAGSNSQDGPAILAGLSAVIYRPFTAQGLWIELVAVHELALRSGEENNEPEWVARAHIDLGDALDKLGRFAEARSHLQLSLAHYQATGELAKQAVTLNALGIVTQHLLLFDESIDYFQRSAQCHRILGNPDELTPLGNLANTYTAAGRFDEAIAALQTSLEMAPPGDLAHLSYARTNLGLTYHKAGRPADAIAPLEEGARLLELHGDTYNQALALWVLGDALHETDRTPEARVRWRESLELLQAMGSLTADEVTEAVAAPVPDRPDVLVDH